MPPTPLLAYLDRLIDEGTAVLATRFSTAEPGCVYSAPPPDAVDLPRFAKWQAGCAHFIHLLGSAAAAWQATFDPKAKNAASTADRMLSTLQAIREVTQHGLLIRLEDLVRAELHEDLLGQADYLLSKGFFLAAGTLGRAVLETHLRAWCELKGCPPEKDRPTLSDFNASLYKAEHVNLTTKKHIDTLTGIGNDAAHNKIEANAADVERLLRDVREVLVRHPLTV